MKIAVLVCLMSLSCATFAFAQRKDAIDQALQILNEICLAGSQARVEYSGEGGISFKSFRPGADGSFVIDERNAKGATGIIDENLRLLADQDVRECMKPHIDKLLSFAFQYNVEESTIKNFDNTSRSSAIMIAPSEGEYTFRGFIPSDDKKRYFKIFSENFTIATLKSQRSDNLLSVGFSTLAGNDIKYEGGFSVGETLEVMLPPNGGYLWIDLYRQGKPTIYEMHLTIQKME